MTTSPQHIAFGNDGRGYGGAVVIVAVGYGHGAAAGVLPVGAAILHDMLQLAADGFFQQLFFRAAGNGNDTVSVAHGGNAVGGLVQGFAYLPGKIRKLADGRVFFKNDLPVSVCEYLQRVAFAEADDETMMRAAADLLM